MKVDWRPIAEQPEKSTKMSCPKCKVVLPVSEFMFRSKIGRMCPRCRLANFEKRFWSKVDKSGDCWLWTKYIQKDGYGSVRPPTGKDSALAHRVAYELVIGPIPDALELDHLCRVRHCVNPAHLEPVTKTENMRRGFSPAALCSRKTHCVKGHPLEGENVYFNGRQRTCKECRRAVDRRRRERNKVTLDAAIRAHPWRKRPEGSPVGNGGE